MPRDVFAAVSVRLRAELPAMTTVARSRPITTMRIPGRARCYHLT
jgi:hypothetical protein